MILRGHVCVLCTTKDEIYLRIFIFFFFFIKFVLFYLVVFDFHLAFAFVNYQFDKRFLRKLNFIIEKEKKKNN